MFLGQVVRRCALGYNDQLPFPYRMILTLATPSPPIPTLVTPCSQVIKGCHILQSDHTILQWIPHPFFVAKAVVTFRANEGKIFCFPTLLFSFLLPLLVPIPLPVFFLRMKRVDFKFENEKQKEKMAKNFFWGKE